MAHDLRFDFYTFGHKGAERLIWLETSQQLVNDCTMLLLLALYL
jgi:hypothetical protein